MPKAKDLMKTDVVETTANETRTITVTMTALAQEFILSDLLRQRGAIGALETTLKQAMKAAVENYLEGAEDLIAGVVTSQRKGGNGTKTKGKAMSEGNEVRTLNGNGNGNEHDIPGDAEGTRAEGEGADVLSLQ